MGKTIKILIAVLISNIVLFAMQIALSVYNFVNLLLGDLKSVDLAFGILDSMLLVMVCFIGITFLGLALAKVKMNRYGFALSSACIDLVLVLYHFVMFFIEFSILNLVIFLLAFVSMILVTKFCFALNNANEEKKELGKS